MFEFVVGIVALLLGGVENVNLAGALVCTGCALASGFITYLLLLECSKKQGSLEISEQIKAFLLVLAFLINIVQPIFLPSIKPGYSSGNGYVSPTQLLCKPFALAIVLIFFHSLKHEQWKLRKQLLLLLLLSISCLAKPVFAMAFVPSMGILLFFEELYKGLQKKEKFSIVIVNTLQKGWFLIACGLILIVQFLYCSQLKLPHGAFMGIDQDSPIRFGWMVAWSSAVANVPISILFAYSKFCTIFATKYE